LRNAGQANREQRESQHCKLRSFEHGNILCAMGA
jgi:hypothetical protein